MPLNADETATHVREVTVADLDLICRHREEMFRDAGSPDDDLAVMTEHFRRGSLPGLPTAHISASSSAATGSRLVAWG